MKVRIEIETNTFVRFWLVIIGFLLTGLAIYSARAALMLIAISFFLALALNIPVAYLARRFPGQSRVASTALAFGIVVAILMLFGALVLPLVFEQTMRIVRTVPDLSDNLLKQWRGAGGFINEYNLQSQLDAVLASAQGQLTAGISGIGSSIISSIGSMLEAIASFLLVIVMAFLMLVEGPQWLNKLWGLYRDETRMLHHRGIAEKMYAMVRGYVTGQIIVAAIGAAISGAFVFALSFIFGTPPGLTLPTAAITFILALIPMFGAMISGILISLLLAANDLSAGITFAIYFIIYQQVENNFIIPSIQARTLELSALTIIVAFTIGFYVLGLAGGIVSVPIAASIKVLIDDYMRRSKLERKAVKGPIAKLADNIREVATGSGTSEA